MLDAIFNSMKESSLKTEDRILALLRENNAMTIPEVAKVLKLSSRAIISRLISLRFKSACGVSELIKVGIGK
jgi:predicted ArsR family transcriptional regulator